MSGSPDPYSPPKSPPEPQTSTPTKSNVVGLGMILLLTPFALATALLIGCGAAYASIEVIPWNTGGITDTIVIVTLLAFLLPPVATLAGMIWWAVRVARRNKPRM